PLADDRLAVDQGAGRIVRALTRRRRRSCRAKRAVLENGCYVTYDRNRNGVMKWPMYRQISMNSNVWMNACGDAVTNFLHVKTFGESSPRRRKSPTQEHLQNLENAGRRIKNAATHAYRKNDASTNRKSRSLLTLLSSLRA